MMTKGEGLGAFIKKNLGPIGVLLLVFLLLVHFTFSNHRDSTNPRSRMITVERLLEEGVWAHESPESQTPFEESIDAIVVNGSRYSSKPPLYPLLMAVQAWPVKQLTGWNYYEKQHFFLHYAVILNQVLPYLVMLWLVLLLGKRHELGQWAMSLLLLTVGLGTLAFSYVPTLNNHVPAASFLFAAFYLLDGFLRDDPFSKKRCLLFGFLLGMAFTYDLPSGIFAFLFLLLMARKEPKKAALSILGASIPVIISAALFYHISGKPVPFYLQKDLYNYPGSYWNNPESLDELNESKLLYAFHSLLGHHGLLSMSPILVLGLLGWWQTRKNRVRKGMALSDSVILGSLVIVAYIIFSTHNYGGWTIGMRWFIVFMPLLAFYSFPIIQKLAYTWWGRLSVIALVAFGLWTGFDALVLEAFIRGHWEQLWY